MLETLLLAANMAVVTELWKPHKPPPRPNHHPCENQIKCETMAHSIYKSLNKKKYKKIRILICEFGTSKDCQVIYDEILN